MDWWQGSRAATSSQCWIASGNFTAVATARDAHIPAGEPGRDALFKVPVFQEFLRDLLRRYHSCLGHDGPSKDH